MLLRRHTIGLSVSDLFLPLLFFHTHLLLASLLTVNGVVENADCVLVVDNEALYGIVGRVSASRGVTSSVSDQTTRKAKSFDDMNNIVANMLLNLTAFV
jgi:hypothetical protein